MGLKIGGCGVTGYGASRAGGAAEGRFLEVACHESGMCSSLPTAMTRLRGATGSTVDGGPGAVADSTSSG
ncbi:hypothetical protein [Streptomyces sp. Ag109_G2-15]|uniref:hypothetical protein n=1 Tax=Streptomyces sp. Ag109_G2-15 TaxID=1938850 RepID=UPI001180DA22|nr:hypothetical protein [Streptomyces sp. Ag109_G2-15]